MDMQRPSPSPQSQDEGEGDENSSCLQMALSYDVDPLLEWLARFDDVTDEDEAIMPVSSLPAPPEMVPMTLPLSGLPNKWLGINLPATGNITDSLAERIHLDKHVEKMKKWMGKWSQQLERVKKGEHRANKPPTPRGRATSSRLPHHFRTNVAKNARDLLANNFFASSVQGFMDLPLEGRLAFYGAKLLAPDMISIPDSSTIATSLSTHCISTLVDPHARSFLAISTLNLLSPKQRKLWREASRYFWLKNSFIPAYNDTWRRKDYALGQGLDVVFSYLRECLRITALQGNSESERNRLCIATRSGCCLLVSLGMLEDNGSPGKVEV
ncbi:hypothetical protein E4T42_05089 [Aureobasidium subglaciale]|nr:hypothetical protein E4T42_05089 [Aureobasidium subglaciale]